MSARGAEGILAQRKAAGLTATGQPQPAPAQAADAPPKQGRVKSAAKGAAGGAVAGPEGAGLGALTGFLSGGKGRRSSGNKALVAEFAVCMALLLLSPMVDRGGDVTVSKWMKKASATAAVFIVLGFLATTGESPRKVAQGLGLLMTLTVLLNERSVFGQLVKAVNGDGTSIPAVGSPSTTPMFSNGVPVHVDSHGSLVTAGGDPAPWVSTSVGGLPLGTASDLGATLGNAARVSIVNDATHVSDANGNGLPPAEQQALQNDPLVNFFKGAVNWVEGLF